jgi:hypothetical protein
MRLAGLASEMGLSVAELMETPAEQVEEWLVISDAVRANRDRKAKETS